MHYVNRPLPPLPAGPSLPSQLIHGIQQLSVHNNQPSIYPPDEHAREDPNTPFVKDTKKEMLEVHPWPELPYYNSGIPELTRSESSDSSSVEYGQVPKFENEYVLRVITGDMQQVSPLQAYSNAEIEHQLTFTNGNTSDAEDEQILQFENPDVLGEHADDARHEPRKLINTNKGAQALYQNKKDNAISNSKNDIDIHCKVDSLSMVPTYLNEESNLTRSCAIVDPDYSFDKAVVKSENQDFEDFSTGKSSFYENVKDNLVSNCHIKDDTNRTEILPASWRSSKFDLDGDMAEHTMDSENLYANDSSQVGISSTDRSESKEEICPVLEERDQVQETRHENASKYSCNKDIMFLR